jgi:hypothetical protein
MTTPRLACVCFLNYLTSFDLQPIGLTPCFLGFQVEFALGVSQGDKSIIQVFEKGRQISSPCTKIEESHVSS